MRNTELKVGMSFRVFEVSNKTCYNDDRLSGRWFCENLDGFMGNPYGVNTPIFSDLGNGRYHLGIDDRQEAKLKAKLTITKLK